MTRLLPVEQYAQMAIWSGFISLGATLMFSVGFLGLSLRIVKRKVLVR